MKKNKKIALISSSVFLFAFILFLLIDLLTKYSYFQFYKDYEELQKFNNYPENEGAWRVALDNNVINIDKFISSYKFTGIRSILNPGITIAGSSKVNVPLIQALSLIISLIVFSFVILFPAKTKYHLFRNFFLAIMVAGVMGNAVDRFHYGGVRDFIFIPSYDNGTFNLADTFIYTGIVFMFLYIIFLIIWEHFKKQSNNKNESIFREDKGEIEFDHELEESQERISNTED